MSRLTRAMSPLPVEPEFDSTASARLRAASPATGNAHAARFPPPDYARLRRLAELYREQPPRRRSWRLLRHAALALAIFTVGTSIGLVAAWWTAKGRLSPASIAAAALPFSLKHGEPVHAATGISQGELPYDGAASVSPPRLPAVPQINPEELPYGGTGAGDGDGGQATPPGMKPLPASGRGAHAAAAARRDEKNDAHAATPERKTVRTAQRYRSARHATKGRSANEREINRLRQQADEEISKKSGRKRPIEDAPPASGRTAAMDDLRHESGKAARTRAQLARCERAANFIRREQCKWRLCSGMWGRNGCPAYVHSTPY